MSIQVVLTPDVPRDILVKFVEDFATEHDLHDIVTDLKIGALVRKIPLALMSFRSSRGRRETLSDLKLSTNGSTHSSPI